ncbi:hypothetical protein VTI74DRAFT_11361 [Chaetomium olivicolor]
MPAPNVSGFSTMRARSYVFRLPLFTRAMIVAIVLFEFLCLQRWWDVRQWGALIPDEIGFATLYRINTFPLIHLNAFHALMNVVALMPLLERFESEYGTLTSLALFFGPLTSLPAFIYIGAEKWVLGSNTAVMGASIWVFLLLAMEAVRASKVNPYFAIAGTNIPTWTPPLIMVLLMAFLVPSSSALGHFAGLVVGYIGGLGYVKYLAPPEWALRWIEGKLNLLGRLPHYVSVDQKTYGRFGVLPLTNVAPAPVISPGLIGSNQRLGP